MSDVDALPDAAADLLDADPEDFDSEDAYRDWVDGRLAELQAAVDSADGRLDDHDDRLDALSTWVESVRDDAADARRRAERAEQMAAWGGLGYEDRVERVVSELVERARRGDGESGKGSIATTTETLTAAQGGRYERPGVVDLFDGAVSERTCRRYVSDLAAVDGLSVVEPDRGGWGGGSTGKRLRLDLRQFAAAHGSEWDGDDLAAEMRGESDG